MPTLAIEPITRAAFAPYGDLIAAEGVEPIAINDGTCWKYPDLATIGTTDGAPITVSLFRPDVRKLPFRIEQIERHPLASQAFLPIGATRFLVIVARPGDAPTAADLRAFLVHGPAGINFRPGTWHHSLSALDAGEFLVVDRRGSGNLEILRTEEWGVGVGALVPGSG